MSTDRTYHRLTIGNLSPEDLADALDALAVTPDNAARVHSVRPHEYELTVFTGGDPADLAMRLDAFARFRKSTTEAKEATTP